MKKIFFIFLFLFCLSFAGSVLAVEVIYHPIDCIWGEDCNTLYLCDGSTTYVGTGNHNDNYSSLHYDTVPLSASDIASWQFCVQGTGSLNTGANSNARCFESNGSSFLHEYCCTDGLPQDVQSFQAMKDWMSLQYWYHQNAGVTNNDTLDCAYYKINYASVIPTLIPTNTPTPTETPTMTPSPTPTETSTPTPTAILIPELQISKSNSGVDNSQGGTEIYTLKIKALKNKVYGVIVKDLPPKGFSFQNVISIIRNGVDDITALVGDPQYHSPGTYNLGDMNVDDIVVIKYQAKIDGSQPFGLYKDLAWASGTQTSDPSSTRVLAQSQPEGFITDTFVGTAVRINGNLTEEGNIDITKEEGQVLGASLPATGANQAWLVLALLLSVFGAISVAVGLMIKKGKLNMLKNIFVVSLFAGILLIGTQSVSAAENVSIRISEPKTPTRINYFTIDYVALDWSNSGSPLTVKCFYKKNFNDGWTQYGPDISVVSPGNSGSCQEVSSIVNTSQTTYYFMANANGVSSDNTIAVDYDSREPGTPTNYSKEKNGCDNKISFKTADDGQTVRVEIYRSDVTSMALNGSTKVGDINIGPNTEGTFNQTVSDCNKTYYYIVRAFSTAGNASNPIGDSVTITTTSTTTSTTAGAIPVSNVTLPIGSTVGESGSVLGEEVNKEGSKEAQKEEVINVPEKKETGNILAAVTKKENRGLVIFASILGLGIIGYGAYYFIKKRKETPQV